MKPYFFNIILGILAFMILIIPFTGKVHDGRFNWFQGFTKRGWIVCIAFILSIGVNYWKDCQAENDSEIKAKTQAKEKKTNDSLALIHTDESNAKIVTAFTKTLAIYGLKYDSSQKIIAKLIKDSSKVINTSPPEINISNITTKINGTNTIAIDFTFKASQSTAYHINITLYSLLEKNNNLELISNHRMFDDTQIGTEFRPTIHKFYWGKKTMESDNIYFLFTGYYFDVKGKKYIYNEIHAYNLASKTTGTPLNPFKGQLIDFVHQKGLKF